MICLKKHFRKFILTGEWKHDQLGNHCHSLWMKREGKKLMCTEYHASALQGCREWQLEWGRTGVPDPVVEAMQVQRSPERMV